MRNLFIILLWALLLVCGIFAYATHRKSVETAQALEASQSELAALRSGIFDLDQKLTEARDTIMQLDSSAQQQSGDLQAARQTQAQAAVEIQRLQAKRKQALKRAQLWAK